ncbi:hypothetical protein NE237_020569 [Protea cynaroides]|uniref:Uncharacterized protein n=1 Tax=Protea cynaroides TaxID=273540 RepID=A0A9Q0H7G8_9MAGN|nr:hypothetical protein NE237_020569 [Protea cynaroides]
MILRPCQQSKKQTIQLSGLDRISPAILYTIFFYNAPPTDHKLLEGEDHIERMKKALEKLLVLWFPAAGRFRINEGTGKLEIDCNDEGVTFFTAVTDSKFEDLGRLHEYKACYEELVPQLIASADISENPLVVVQITKFACGGLAVGFGSSHALFDGAGSFNFLSSWAHISSGKPESDLVVPNHSRNSLLDAIFSPDTSSVAASIYEQDHIAAIQDLYRIPVQAMTSDDRCWETALATFGQLDPQRGLQLLTISRKKEVVEKLKGIAIEGGKLSKCSTFDVICAHVWRARVRALSLPQNTNICLQFPVDSRNRLQPTLGQNFTGNAFVLASVSCLVKELQEEALHDTIRRIQAAKDAITDEYVKLYVKALESSDKFFPSMRELTIVTDWMKFPFQALDFGWGKISSAAILATPVPETAYLMPNLEEPGAFLVRIGIGVHEVQNFIDIFSDSS